MTDPKPKLRWFQFRLRTLLIAVTLCAIACSWLAVTKQEGRRQMEAVAAIEKLGGEVTISDPPRQKWWRRLLGDDFFYRVTGVLFPFIIYPKDNPERSKYPPIQGPKVTDADLEHLVKGLGQLRSLDICGGITDHGLEHLTGLSQLQHLRLDCPLVTDDGLESLKGLSQLRTLYFACHCTQVSDDGVKKLQEALPKCKIVRLSDPFEIP